MRFGVSRRTCFACWRTTRLSSRCPAARAGSRRRADRRDSRALARGAYSTASRCVGRRRHERALGYRIRIARRRNDTVAAATRRIVEQLARLDGARLRAIATTWRSTRASSGRRSRGAGSAGWCSTTRKTLIDKTASYLMSGMSASWSTRRTRSEEARRAGTAGGAGAARGLRGQQPGAARLRQRGRRARAGRRRLQGDLGPGRAPRARLGAGRAGPLRLVGGRRRVAGVAGGQPLLPLGRRGGVALRRRAS